MLRVAGSQAPRAGDPGARRDEPGSPETATGFASLAQAALGALAGANDPVGVTLSVLEPERTHVRQYFGGPDVPATVVARYLRTEIIEHTPHTSVLRSGAAELFADPDELRARYPELADEFEAVGVRRGACLPLRDDGNEVIGALSVGWAVPAAFEERDLDALRDVAEAVAKVVERLRAIDARRALAESLQTSLLAVRPSSTAAVVRASSRAADGSLEAGGDFYDVVELDEGRLAVAMGDVPGRGVVTATAVRELRRALSVAIVEDADPANALGSLEALAERTPGALGTTAAVSVLDAPRRRLLHHAAGHPFPVLASDRGEVACLTAGRSLPLGAGRPNARATATVPFAPTSTLVAINDGLLVAGDRSIEDGYELLLATLREHWWRPTSAICDELRLMLLDGCSLVDDAAYVLLRSCGSSPRVHADAFAADPNQLGGMRRRLGDWLASTGAPASVIEDVSLAASEASANAIEHGSELGDVVRVEAGRRDGELVLSVADSGRWSSGIQSARGGRGRGHLIMERLSSGLGIESGRDGSVVTLRFELP